MATASEPRPQLPGEVAAALARGAAIVTSNMRAARALRTAYAVDARAQGMASWSAPAIDDWQSWLADMYRRLAAGDDAGTLPLLLTDMQEQRLWRTVQAEQAAAVVSPEDLAQLAAEAYMLLSDYEAHPDRRAPWAAAHEDAEHFVRWAAAFDRECTRLDVLPRAALAATLQAHAGALQPGPEILLVGFDRLLPAQAALLEALAARGMAYARAAVGEQAQSRELRCAADENEEMYACAMWVRAQLEASPDRRIAVLLPQLHGARAALDRVFRRTLTPESAMQPPDGRVPYEFSLGVPLAGIPVVAAALDLLRWTAEPLPSARVSNLLIGGFAAASAAESLRLAEADVSLRRRGLLTAQLALDALLGKGRQLLPHGFIVRATAVAEQARRNAARKRAYSEWAAHAEEQLAAFGWPGFRESSSVAFQARQRWSALLAEMASLGFAGERVSWADFLLDLRSFAERALFAAESRSAPVQIMGIAEASGQHFDAIWLMAATEDRWPATGRMHPLLAPAVQRDRAMPHSSHTLDLQLAQAQFERVLASAPVMVASYAAQREGAETRPSPLLRSVAATTIAVEAMAPLDAAAPATERVAEPAIVRPWPAVRVAGGSDVLKRQSACGFQSFAAKRLGAEGLEEERWGLDPRERGGLLHAVMEQLWSSELLRESDDRLHTSADLHRGEDEGTLEEKVHAAVSRALKSRRTNAQTDAWMNEYLVLESERLERRVLWWLEEELKREPFTVIGLEREVKSAAVGPLLLNLRVDRVDELEDGGRLVLDYKTAAVVNVRQWMGDRPEEPQLPIYARFGGIEDVEVAAFAQVRAGHTKLHILEHTNGDAALALPQGTPGEGTGAAWDRILPRLAEEYARGDASVNPRDGSKTCDRCGLYGICRVRAQGDLLPPDSEDEEAGDDD